VTAAGGDGGPACVTGRFQPVHDDHLRLFRIALAERGRLIVGVTNPDPASRRPEPASAHRHLPESNPFTFAERVELIVAALGADEARFVPFDLARPEGWARAVPLGAVQYVGRHGPWEAEKARRLAAAGYRVVEVEPPPGARRSGTAIREAMRAGTRWEGLVPAATVEPLRAMLARRAAEGGVL
jgi:nicotinamide-nucleotide adenylyltransferase